MNEFKSLDAAINFVREALKTKYPNTKFSVGKTPKDATERSMLKGSAKHQTIFIRWTDMNISYQEVPRFVESKNIKLHAERGRVVFWYARLIVPTSPGGTSCHADELKTSYFVRWRRP